MTNRDLYITTISGRRFYFEDMAASDIVIEDIAHSLARQARYCGHTKGDRIYSVAQHCVLVAWWIEQNKPSWTNDYFHVRLQLAGLLHDAPEYVLGDISGPLKAVLRKGQNYLYDKMEGDLSFFIEQRFGVPGGWFEHPLIKKADYAIRHNEAAAFCHSDIVLCEDHPGSDSALEGLPIIDAWPIEISQERFLSLFHHLSSALTST